MILTLKRIIRFGMLLFIGNVMYILSTIIPKKNNLWIFGAWLEKDYADNSKYLFEFISKKHPEIRAVWIARRRNVYDLIRAKGYAACMMNSLRGYWFTIRAEVAFVCQKVDISYHVLNKKTKVIQLWHGIPLKKIGYDDPIYCYRQTFYHKIRRYAIKYLMPYFMEEPSIIVATSEDNKKTFKTSFRISDDKIKITGFPRNDALYHKSVKRTSLIEGIYMPTFRGELGSRFDFFEQYGFNVEKVDSYLKKNRMRLYLKLHPMNIPYQDIVEKVSKSHAIRIWEEEDIYEYLNMSDFLITDYSSIYFDYLLLDKPIIFAPFDLEDYMKKDRELYYDYGEVTPGPKAKNWDEVLTYISESIDCPEKYKEERARIRDMFHEYKDGNSCKRVYEEVVKLL